MIRAMAEKMIEPVNIWAGLLEKKYGSRGMDPKIMNEVKVARPFRAAASPPGLAISNSCFIIKSIQ